jgi:glucosylceramidase
MGASDFVAGPHYTYDDVPAGRTDFRLKHFSIAHDRAEILPLLRQALRLNPHLKVMATPWSPPAWMKTNDSLVGGRFKDDPRVYDAYARYFVRFVQAYRRAGVPIDAVTLQNEPQNRNPSAYPGMDLRDDKEARLVVAVGRAFQRAHIHTKILGYDHNWSLHPNDGGPPDDPANPEYAASLLSNPAARHYLAGTAFHCYPATRSSSRSSTTPSRRRTSTSRSARARCRANRRRPSPTRCTGTPASSPSGRCATGPRPSSRGTWRWIRPADRTTAAATRASAW